MTKFLRTGAREDLAGGASERGAGPESLTARGRSGRLPRHEADLSAQEGEEKQDTRVPAADEVARRPCGREEPSREGAKTPRTERAEEVGDRLGVRFPKAARLTRRGEFVAVQRRGRRVDGGAYLVFTLENDLGHARLGVSVSKRIGSAVTRNRVKRWVREAFRVASPGLPPVDLVVVARQGAAAGGLGCAQRAVAGAGRRGRA